MIENNPFIFRIHYDPNGCEIAHDNLEELSRSDGYLGNISVGSPGQMIVVSASSRDMGTRFYQDALKLKTAPLSADLGLFKK